MGTCSSYANEMQNQTMQHLWELEDDAEIDSECFVRQHNWLKTTVSKVHELLRVHDVGSL